MRWVAQSFVLHHRLHEFVGDADAVVGILEEDGAVRFAIDRDIIARLHQRPGFAFFLGLAFNKLLDIRVIDVQDHHFGGTTRLSAGLDDAREGVVALHKR